MKLKLSNTLTALALAAFAIAPAFSAAGGHGDKDKDKHKEKEHHRKSSSHQSSSSSQNRQSELARQSARRQQTKNEWRNIAYVSGAVTLLGLLKKDKTLVFAGAAGTLYSLYRYEQDRKSQSSMDRARASYFSRPYFVRNGVRYNRRTVVKNGQKFYQFRRA